MLKIIGVICVLVSFFGGILSCLSKNWEYGIPLIISSIFIFSLIKTLNSLTDKVEILEKKIQELTNKKV